VSVKCGHCGDKHEGIDDVRRCAKSEPEGGKKALVRKKRRRKASSTRRTNGGETYNGATGCVAPTSPAPNDRELHKQSGPTQNQSDDT